MVKLSVSDISNLKMCGVCDEDIFRGLGYDGDKRDKITAQSLAHQQKTISRLVDFLLAVSLGERDAKASTVTAAIHMLNMYRQQLQFENVEGDSRSIRPKQNKLAEKLVSVGKFSMEHLTAEVQ